jgi:hypothetical protein
MSEMLRGVIANQAQKLVHIVKSLPATVGTLKDAASTAVAHSPLLGGPKGTGNLSAGAAHGPQPVRHRRPRLRHGEPAAARAEGNRPRL